MGKVALDTVHVPSVEHPKSKPAIFTPAYVVCPSVALGPGDAEWVSLDWAVTVVIELAVTVAFVMAVGTEDKEDSVVETAVKADAMADLRAQGILGSTAGTR